MTYGARMGTNSDFFGEQREQSTVKSAIVEAYFVRWAQIMIAVQDRADLEPLVDHDHRIGYVDLFAGPGRFDDGKVSTPIRLLELAASHPKIAKRLVARLNDRDNAHCESLQCLIDDSLSLKQLTHRPVVTCSDAVSSSIDLLRQLRGIPTLAFIDPWGYKGLSRELIDAALQDWGCDCIFFFNYNRVNAGLANDSVKALMDGLFGASEAEALRKRLEPLSPAQREAAIVTALSESLQKRGRRFVLPFCFKTAGGTRTSHHLILVTKHFRGYEVMKEIMHQNSNVTEGQGVASFTFSPGAEKQGLLFELNRPLDDLRDLLLSEFRGQTLSMSQLYEQHSVGRPYVRRHYRDALLQLEAQGLVTVGGRKLNKAGEPIVRGFPEHLAVTFP
jgi:three-Cys-motif partner protein